MNTHISIADVDGGGAGNLILNGRDIALLRNYVKDAKMLFEAFENDVNNVLKGYDTDEVVQSFYASGVFGQEKQEQLKQFSDAVRALKDSLSGPGMLFDQTDAFCDQHEHLINSGSGFGPNKGMGGF